MKYVLAITMTVILTSCSLFHHEQAFELEAMSRDILTDKNHEGISIVITPIPPGK